MATYRYCDVRRDIYELCSSNPLKKYRTFSDIKNLFKISFWLMLLGMIICLLAYIILLLILPDKLYWIIPASCTPILAIIGEIFEEKMYVPSERKKELEEKSANFDNYIQSIKTALSVHDIVTKEQRQILKSECENQLSLHNKNYKSISNKVFDLLIGVPLGALISALIYKSESTDIIIGQLIVIIVFGLMIIGIANITKKITYYSDGYFKDRCLLDVLKELDYLSE